MTIRNLDRVLAPRRVAIIGASSRPRAVGHLVLSNMRTAKFPGTLMPVNPRESEIDGLRTFPDIDALPEDPDLAVIATPPDTTTPAQTIESTAMPVRPGSWSTNFAGGSGSGQVRIGHSSL